MARELGPGVVQSFDADRAALLEKLASDDLLQQSIAEKLRGDFNDNIAQSHDFLQLVKLVRGHSEALLYTAHPHLPPEDAADCEPALGAIYYSTSLMIAKLDALVYLNEINRAFGAETEFRIHPLVLKYVRIYLWQARQKNVRISLDGASYSSSFYDNGAIGAVIQSLLDNLVKYAPAGSKASIRFFETAESVRVEFVSLGPRLDATEVRDIFMPGFRSEAARNGHSEGQGIGLATVKRVSDALGLDVKVKQEGKEDSTFTRSYETVFSITLSIA